MWVISHIELKMINREKEMPSFSTTTIWRNKEGKWSWSSDEYRHPRFTTWRKVARELAKAMWKSRKGE